MKQRFNDGCGFVRHFLMTFFLFTIVVSLTACSNATQNLPFDAKLNINSESTQFSNLGKKPWCNFTRKDHGHFFGKAYGSLTTTIVTPDENGDYSDVEVATFSCPRQTDLGGSSLKKARYSIYSQANPEKKLQISDWVEWNPKFSALLMKLVIDKKTFVSLNRFERIAGLSAKAEIEDLGDDGSMNPTVGTAEMQLVTISEKSQSFSYELLCLAEVLNSFVVDPTVIFNKEITQTSFVTNSSDVPFSLDSSAALGAFFDTDAKNYCSYDVLAAVPTNSFGWTMFKQKNDGSAKTAGVANYDGVGDFVDVYAANPGSNYLVQNCKNCINGSAQASGAANLEIASFYGLQNGNADFADLVLSVKTKNQPSIIFKNLETLSDNNSENYKWWEYTYEKLEEDVNSLAYSSSYNVYAVQWMDENLPTYNGTAQILLANAKQINAGSIYQYGPRLMVRDQTSGKFRDLFRTNFREYNGAGNIGTWLPLPPNYNICSSQTIPCAASVDRYWNTLVVVDLNNDSNDDVIFAGGSNMGDSNVTSTKEAAIFLNLGVDMDGDGIDNFVTENPSATELLPGFKSYNSCETVELNVVHIQQGMESDNGSLEMMIIRSMKNCPAVGLRTAVWGRTGGTWSELTSTFGLQNSLSIDNKFIDLNNDHSLDLIGVSGTAAVSASNSVCRGNGLSMPSSFGLSPDNGVLPSHLLNAAWKASALTIMQAVGPNTIYSTMYGPAGVMCNPWSKQPLFSAGELCSGGVLCKNNFEYCYDKYGVDPKARLGLMTSGSGYQLGGKIYNSGLFVNH